jgi:predicted amidohydrolase YtcJ
MGGKWYACANNTLIFVSSDSGPTYVQCVHAIGDKTNGAVLDALEVALEHAEVPAIRPRIEHAQLMDRKDIARLGKTGGISDRSLA